MGHFDCWASRFGETTTALELAPEGTGYRARTRFAKFFNLPELMNLFKEVADIKTADQLHLPTPEVAYHTIATKPTHNRTYRMDIVRTNVYHACRNLYRFGSENNCSCAEHIGRQCNLLS